MAAAMSYGDITQGGVGTATSVCDGRVVGFGHPAAFTGATTMTLHPADAQSTSRSDPLGVPFKLANLGAPAGTVTDDHTTGITGSFGALPHVTDITSTVVYGTRTAPGSSHVSVPDAAASTDLLPAARQPRPRDRRHPGRLGAPGAGRSRGDDNGTPFTCPRADRYASDVRHHVRGAVGGRGHRLLPELVPRRHDRRRHDRRDVVDDAVDVAVSAVQQKRAGEWVTRQAHGTPALAKAGKTLALRAVLKGSAGTAPRCRCPSTSRRRRAASAAWLCVTGGAWTGRTAVTRTASRT